MAITVLPSFQLLPRRFLVSHVRKNTASKGVPLVESSAETLVALQGTKALIDVVQKRAEVSFGRGSASIS
jgi:hypothetical protein